ncbi:MAG: acyl-CoA dehydratase activase-related protein [Tannerellaceae bacterium]|jgi:predicted CoA-substrate-specific enzyme activase|nr:acyl-CoA dehydratase activase-related protein [Tannerellaceae bacterium]
MTSEKVHRIGIDVGSTTVKLVVLSPQKKIVHKGYRRHQADVVVALREELLAVSSRFPSLPMRMVVTGSAGMGVAERLSLPFVQEVVASIDAVRRDFPHTRTLIDLGGEDAKMVFFDTGKQPDIRMNGSCAGGTGAFIDQMAVLMNISVDELGEQAMHYETIHPIASRCGVFAKTDVQNLLARNVATPDVARSVLHTVALQTLASLARGHSVPSPILCIGGPLTFLPALRQAFAELLHAESIAPENGAFFPAYGAALHALDIEMFQDLTAIISRLDTRHTPSFRSALQPLFAGEDDYTRWKAERKQTVIPFVPIDGSTEKECKGFLGIDSGSTTTKIVVIDEKGNLRYSYYADNDGHPLPRLVEGLQFFYRLTKEKGLSFRFLASAATGYGEELIKAAFGLDYGIVETIAHLAGAQHIDPNVSFVLDIGGQDIKSIFTHNGVISRVELNEACSSGCGSFLQNFASTLGLTPADFARSACLAKNPNDLGTRCTVFMNSKVKQSLRENASLGDIAAGLAYSVVRNCLFKVLKINNLNLLGEHIVVQGGAFRNDAVYRAFEILSGKTVSSTDRPELMGALGAALFARQGYKRSGTPSTFTGQEPLPDLSTVETADFSCKGCTNRCSVRRFRFQNGNVCHAGNRCEKIFYNKFLAPEKGYNAFVRKNELLFGRVTSLPDGRVGESIPQRKIRIGIPRVLNMYENFPFWHTLLSRCGFDVVLSPESTFPLYRTGVTSIMSDTVCFPAKLVHGHILALVEQKVDRIFYPLVIKEEAELVFAGNSFNCPVVAGYPDVVRSSIEPQETFGIPFDKPVISFENSRVLSHTACAYLSTLGVKHSDFDQAFEAAVRHMEDVRLCLIQQQLRLFEQAVATGRTIFVVAGRPYHADPLIQQKAGQIISDLGADAFTDDIFRRTDSLPLRSLDLVSQWAFPNRPVQAAIQVARLPANVQLVQLNSFGCGPDSFFLNEISDILKRSGKNHTVLRIDEIAAPGSIRLRLRSLVESLKLGLPPVPVAYTGYVRTYSSADKQKTILVPWFSDFVSPFLPAIAALAGLKLVNLPPSSQTSADYGLEYGNNEVCYPLTLVIGDIISALRSGHYDTTDVVVAMTQTGGQCRATNYISQIKGALKTAGFGYIPVLSLFLTGDACKNPQDFHLPLHKIAIPLLHTLLYADSLQQLFSATVVREIRQGDSRRLFDHYVERGIEIIDRHSSYHLFPLLKQAVDDFNQLPLSSERLTPVGLIGEIYVKYNSYAQAHITSWLRAQKMEVVTPPLLDFFLQYFVNSEEDIRNGLTEDSLLRRSLSPVIYRFVNRKLEKTERILSEFRFYRPQVSVYTKADYAAEVLSLSNQFGEGWLIAAEIACYARAGIDRIVCLQPFGCIANHVVAKGIEKRLKKLYPHINLLYLDLDSGMADVNLKNRLYFLINRL